ncbi:ATP-binding protein [Rhodocytophaga rosea]|uniref:ATP-binding protein n=1 Tax=Rhodocytophaga rosea TaxID=2704465 RepID=A0A6C0GBZ0_9BACT|nr:ATP-binding protein [Rhodocytophaga rosea]QHT65408.1 ATP-binding protein [Rhodocytophaga rosea]
MAEISNNNTGLSGEYFVAAELYRRGWSVGMTIGNAKAVDLFAEKDNRKIAIQVKSIYKKKNVGWPIMKTCIKDDCLYIFVNLNADKMESPDYYICTSTEVKNNMKQYSTRGIITLSALNQEQFKGNWKKLELTKDLHANFI